MMKRIFRYCAFAALAALLGLVLRSCEDKYPAGMEQPYLTELTAIKIVNAGPGGNMVMEGRIDEANKMIDFKRIDPATDFSALKVEAQLSEGATLEKDVFDFSMDEETAEKTLLLRVKNHARYKDYFIRVKKKIPVFGADWEKVQTYPFCASANTTYPDYTSNATRGAAFDGEYVLVLSRNGGVKPHILKVADLKQGKIEPIMLDLTGVAGGTFPIHSGAVIKGHTYVANLSGGGKWSPLKIYHYETPASVPETILNVTLDGIDGANTRHGDNASFNLDDKGNGYVYFGSNNAADILRFDIKNWTEVSNPTVLPSNKSGNSYITVNRILGTDKYIYGGLYMSPKIVDASMSVLYDLKAGSVAAQSTACQVIEFNAERYLVTLTGGRTENVNPTVYVYDITKGGDKLEDGLNSFESKEIQPVYTFVLGGGKNIAPGTNLFYSIEKDAEGKDSKLYLFASRCNSGFAILEFPIKVALDD